MKTRFIPALVTLLAATGVSIINIIKKTPTVTGLKYLLIVIIVFYILGTIAKVLLNRTLVNKEEPEDSVTEDESQDMADDDTVTESTSTNDKIDE